MMSDKAKSKMGKRLLQIGIIGFIASGILMLIYGVQEWIAYAAIPSGLMLVIGFTSWIFFFEPGETTPVQKERDKSQ